MRSTKTVAKYDEWRTTSDFARLCCNFDWISWTRYLIIWRCRTMSNIQRHSWFTRVVPNFSILPLRPSFFSAHVSTNYFQIFQSPKKTNSFAWFYTDIWKSSQIRLGQIRKWLGIIYIIDSHNLVWSRSTKCRWNQHNIIML